MRSIGLGSAWSRREPRYDRGKEDARLNKRLHEARSGNRPATRYHPDTPRRIVRWCTRCTSPTISAAPLEFDEHGVCTACRTAETKRAIPKSEWDHRRRLLEELTDQSRFRDGSRHDCVIAVSGGKDSYYQVHLIKNELNLNPLLVTYDGNNWTPAGRRNMDRMKEVFGVDHMLISPSVDTLKKVNRLAFKIMGDMNWHSHVGIMTVPMKVAAERGISLVFYGEHGYLDLCGQFSMNDFPEINYRDRQEHFARGYEWTYFVDREGLDSSDLLTWKYPDDKDLFDLDLRGLCLGNYFYWEANEHAKLMIDKFGFEVSDEPFDRTYRTISNLDDMHENGVHDYLKYVKFGYGRATDHTSKDIRAGLMTREEGFDLVRKYDPVRPRDLSRWLEYVGMNEDEFDRIADTFRDPRVWREEDGHWVRDAPWGLDVHTACRDSPHQGTPSG
jgi:N-acetyl sugar amidotransferase